MEFYYEKISKYKYGEISILDFLCQKMTLLLEISATINLIKGCFLAK